MCVCVCCVCVCVCACVHVRICACLHVHMCKKQNVCVQVPTVHVLMRTFVNVELLYNESSLICHNSF